MILFIKTQKRTRPVECLLMSVWTSLYLLLGIYLLCSQNKNIKTNGTSRSLPLFFTKTLWKALSPSIKVGNVPAPTFSTFYEIYQVSPLQRGECLHCWPNGFIVISVFIQSSLFKLTTIVCKIFLVTWKNQANLDNTIILFPPIRDFPRICYKVVWKLAGQLVYNVFCIR